MEPTAHADAPVAAPADAPAADRPNAFVGPQPIPPDRRLYGRDRELLALTNRLLSERLVLLYSPSGAGKSSLIMAKGGVRERLKAEGIRPLPVVRVNLCSEVAAKLGANRYLLSTLAALEADRPADVQRTLEELAEVARVGNLDAHLTHLQEEQARCEPPAEDCGDPPPQSFLVFDQFEEFLTLDPTDGDAKREFLRRIGEALKDGDRWALFAMREDHVAALDPYLPLLPGRLAPRFRLDLLGKAAAKDAAQLPPREADFGAVDFQDDAVEDLLRELAQIQVMDPGTGKSEVKTGPYVEPLHLQVVCQRLWEVRAEPGKITKDDLDRLTHGAAGELRGVTAALAAYYDDAVRETAALFAGTRVTERGIRDWFGQSAISPAKLRLPVLLGEEADNLLTPEVLKRLADRYLIRKDQRHGLVYYELSHDRLVDPVLKSNAAWDTANLSPFFRAAKLWQESDKSADLLVSGEVLEGGERAFAERRDDFTAEDREFLDACVKTRDLKEQARTFARWKALGVTAFVLMIAAFSGFLWWSDHRARRADLKSKGDLLKKETEKLAEAERLNKVIQAQQFYQSAKAWLADDPEASADFAAKSLKLYEDSETEDIPFDLNSQILPQALANRTMKTFGLAYTGKLLLTDDLATDRLTSAVTELLLTGPSRQWLIARGADGTVMGWENPWQQKLPERPKLYIPSVARMAATPGGEHLVVGHFNGRVCVWDLKTRRYQSPREPNDSPVTALSVNREGGRPLAVVGYANGKAALVDWSAAKSLPEWEVSKQAVVNAIITSNDARVLTDSRDRVVQAWDISRVKAEGREAPAKAESEPIRGDLTRLAIDPTGELVAASTERGAVLLVATAPKAKVIGELNLDTPEVKEGVVPTRRVSTLAFGPTRVAGPNVRQYLLFAGSDNGAAAVYSLSRKAGELLPPLRGTYHYKSGHPTSAAFDPTGNWLAVGTGDGSTYFWQVYNAAKDEPLVLKTTVNPVTAVLLTAPEGGARGGRKGWLFTGQADGAVRRWDLATQVSRETIKVDLEGLGLGGLKDKVAEYLADR